MDATNWFKQTADKPLFNELLWSRPENKAHAGKLLIVGGNLHGFSAPASAYQCALKAGIGTVRVILPDALKKTLGKVFETGEFVPSTPSGSMSKLALGELLDAARWADGVLLAGDLGRNSETAALIETFMHHHEGQISLVQDSVEFLTASPRPNFERKNSCFVLTMPQLQRLFIAGKYSKALLLEMPPPKLVGMLQDFTSEHQLTLIVKQLGTIHVAFKGKVSSTRVDDGREDSWRIETAAQAAVWWAQNPDKTFEALTTSLVA